MTSPSAPAGAESASPASSSESTRSIDAVASSTRAALSVQTRGRKRPVASAKPATVPTGSALGASATLNTVPEVPIETITSPGPAPTPSAAAALSPCRGRAAPRRAAGGAW